MKCISGHQPHFLCINKDCHVTNSCVCADPEDDCKASHEPCSLISLSYILKRTRNLSVNNKSRTLSKLIPIYEKAKHIASTINAALAATNFVREINTMLE